LPEHRDGEERRREITQAGHQPEDRVQADANLGPWKHERGIEQTRNLLQRLEALLLSRGQRTWARRALLHISILGPAPLTGDRLRAFPPALEVVDRPRPVLPQQPR
jgi:hypothetical protein